MHRTNTGDYPTQTSEKTMNIRNTIAALALGMASSMAMAATPAKPVTPGTASISAPTKAKHVANKTKECKSGETLAKGKCEKTKSHT